MAESAELIRKLQIKAGTRLRLINVPTEIAGVLTAAAEVEPVKAGDPYDAVIAFCESPADVASLAPRALEKLPEDGLLWFAHRKGNAGKAAGLTRDIGWAPLEKLGYETVRSISFDGTWSGLRFRETARVKNR